MITMMIPFCLAGKFISLNTFQNHKLATYRYDFGDGYHHVLLEAILLKEEGIRYPKCIAGEWLST